LHLQDIWTDGQVDFNISPKRNLFAGNQNMLMKNAPKQVIFNPIDSNAWLSFLFST